MREKIIELFLTGNAKLREQCLDTIVDQFKVVRPWQYYQNPSPQLARFFRFEIKTDKNIWDIAAALLKINGVIEADPVEQTHQSGAYDSDEDYPTAEISTLWNHEATKFTQARQRVDKTEKVQIRIAQLDTGYTKHTGIINRLTLGYDFLDNDPDPFDPLVDGLLKQPGHGTSTASVIIGGGFQPNPSSIQAGVWPDANLQVYRIARSVVHVFHSYISDAICKAVESGCDVITMSMGGAPPRRSWLEAIRYAYDKGVIVCCAAGNNVGFVIWPARYTNAIAVAGINVNDQKWEGSCSGEDVDVSAPGENIYVAQTTRGADDGLVFLNTYGSGTSFATPHVAAAAAMWLHHYRKELVNFNGRTKVDAFRWALESSVRVPMDWPKDKLGKGILDADRLLQFSPKDYKPTSIVPKGLKKTMGFKMHRSGNKIYEEEKPLLGIHEKELMHLLFNTDGKTATDKMNKIQTLASDTVKTQLQEMNKLAKKNIEAAKKLPLKKKAKGLTSVSETPKLNEDKLLQNLMNEQLIKMVENVS
jgi:predicted transcriptional regulator